MYRLRSLTTTLFRFPFQSRGPARCKRRVFFFFFRLTRKMMNHAKAGGDVWDERATSSEIRMSAVFWVFHHLRPAAPVTDFLLTLRFPLSPPPPSPFVPEGETKNSCSQFVFPLQLSACAADQPTFKAMISSDPPPPSPSYTHPLPSAGGGEGGRRLCWGVSGLPK